MSEDDVLMVPNIPLISGIPKVKSMGFIAELGFKTILAATRPKEFQNLSMSKYFSGYNDDFMSLISKFKWDFNPDDVAILAPRRGVTKKSLTVDSGTDVATDVGKVYALGEQTKMNLWKSEECNAVAGSDGIIYGPALVQRKEDLQVYLPNFCRSLPLVFDKEVHIKGGMRSFRYQAPFGTFSSPESFPENKFYCELKSVKEKHVDGVLDVSGSIDGNPPVFISHPHFMEGDSQLFEHFEGLTPNASLHSSFAYIHPRLSVPIFGSSKMQLNLKVSHFGKYYKNLPEGIILPLAWIETTSEDFPDYIMTQLFLSTIVVDGIEIFFKFSSLISFILSMIFLIYSKTKSFKFIAVKIRKNLTSPVIKKSILEKA